MQRFADAQRAAGKKIAVVPTMGALHDGHLSLIRLAIENADVVVCTIFVNPTQFGPNEDFSTYPRAFETDVRKAAEAGAQVVFAPSVDEMYAGDHQTFVVNDRIASVLEGAERPGHFKGVATIVLKLMTAVKPHVAVFGQKDAQQLALIRTMVRDLGVDVEVLAGPILREPDGLAMSSRNVYLEPDQRKRATALNKALTFGESLAGKGERDLTVIKDAVRSGIEQAGPDRIDYIEAVDPDTFATLSGFRKEGTLIVLVARFGTTRLLDNRLLYG